MASPKPKPSALKLVDLPILQPSRLNKKNIEEAQCITGDISTPPAWLSESQLEHWNYALEHAPPGLLKKIDQSIFLMWIVAQDTHTRACIELQKSSMLIYSESKQDYVPNPLLNIIDKQAGIIKQAAGEMGFTPSSRTRVSIGNKTEDANPFARNGKRNLK